MNHKYSSFLKPALESVVEEVDGPVEWAESADDVVLADELRAMRETSGQMEATTEKVVALESVVTLLREERRMTATEARLVSIVADRYGVPMGHRRIGAALEAFEGSNGGRLGTITLESFSDHLRKAIEFIISLLRKLRDHMVRIFSIYSGKLGALKRTITTNKDFPNHAKKPMTEQMRTSIAVLFTVNHRFDPRTSISNLKEVLAGISDNGLVGGVQLYSEQLVELAERFGRDQTESENWRSHVGDFNRLTPPVPKGFEIRTQDVTETVMVSKTIPGCVRLSYTTVSEGNTAGARGVRERVKAMAKLGNVQVVDDKANDDPNQLRGLTADEVRGMWGDVIDAMNEGERTEKLMQRVAASIEPLTHKIEQLRLNGDGIGSDRGNVINDIITAVPRSLMFVAELGQAALKSAEDCGKCYNLMVYHRI